MPVYTYRREDGTLFEIQQRFSDDPLTIDPTTGQKVVRVVTAPGIIFKGSGFYVTDNKKGSNGGSRSSDKSETKTETAAESKTESKAEAKAEGSKPEAKPAPSVSTPPAD
jgi:putative FmdB family regulatory protein